MDEYGERRGGFRGGRGRFGGGGQSNLPKPVAVGDVVEVTIEATGAKGDGIAKKDGFVIFVKGASQGQTVKVKITSMGRSSASAEVVSGEPAAQPEPAAEAEPAAEPADEGDGEDIQQ
ncbi:MAG: TRAM domain-containing protein [Candidatus Micrarchaeia archaeon]